MNVSSSCVGQIELIESRRATRTFRPILPTLPTGCRPRAGGSERERVSLVPISRELPGPAATNLPWRRPQINGRNGIKEIKENEREAANDVLIRPEENGIHKTKENR